MNRLVDAHLWRYLEGAGAAFLMLQTSETGFNPVFRAQGTEGLGMTLTAYVCGCVPAISLSL